MSLTLNLIFVMLLIIANGVLAMAEIAIVTARKEKLRNQADRGNKNAQAALTLAGDPNEFLSTVQIGITLVGILAGAFGGATISESIRPFVERIPFLAHHSESLSFGFVVIVITYLSLVVGELAPKRLGLWRPESIAASLARPMRALSRVAHPAVWILGVSTDFLLKALGLRKDSAQSNVTEEEIKILIRQATQAGAVTPVEKEIIDRVFLLGDRTVVTMMTPRPDIDWIDLNQSPTEVRQRITESSHSRFPVGRGRLNEFLGIVTAKDLLKGNNQEGVFNIEGNLRQPLFVPETMSGFVLLENFRKGKTQFALVVDEYGAITGVITMNDVLQAIVGELPGDEQSADVPLVRRNDGSWLADGMIPMLDLREIVPVARLQEQGEDYRTLAGFVLARLGRIPVTGNHFEFEGIHFEVVDMDRNRIDRVLIIPKHHSS